MNVVYLDFQKPSIIAVHEMTEQNALGHGLRIEKFTETSRIVRITNRIIHALGSCDLGDVTGWERQLLIN